MHSSSQAESTPSIWALGARGLGHLVSGTVVALTLFALSVITTLSLTTSVWPMNEVEAYNENFTIWTLLSVPGAVHVGCGIIAAVLAFLAGRWLFRLLPVPSKRGVMCAVITMLCLSLCAQVALVLVIQTRDYVWGDSWYLMQIAREAIASPGGVWAYLRECASANQQGGIGNLLQNVAAYLQCYPFQTTVFVLYVCALRAFGENASMAIQIANAISNTFVAACLLWMTSRLLRGMEDEDSRRKMLVCTFLTGLCLPLWMSSLYVYGNQVGTALAFVFLVMQVKSSDAEPLWQKVAWQAGSVIPLAMAIAVKQTTMLFAIGTIVAWLVEALVNRRRHRWIVLLACLGAIALSVKISAVPENILLERTGIPDLPMTTYNHIEVGLRQSEHATIKMSVDDGDIDGAPGWYCNVTVERWLEAQGDADRQEELTTKAIQEDIDGYGTLAGALKFAVLKTASEWCAPDFQGFFFMANARNAEGIPAAPLRQDQSVVARRIAQMAMILMDGLQLLVYASSIWFFVHVIRRPRNGDSRKGLPFVGHLLIGLLFTGFGCYLIWEAKGIYTLPFFFFLLPLASMALPLPPARKSA